MSSSRQMRHTMVSSKDIENEEESDLDLKRKKAGEKIVKRKVVPFGYKSYEAVEVKPEKRKIHLIKTLLPDYEVLDKPALYDAEVQTDLDYQNFMELEDEEIQLLEECKNRERKKSLADLSWDSPLAVKMQVLDYLLVEVKEPRESPKLITLNSKTLERSVIEISAILGPTGMPVLQITIDNVQIYPETEKSLELFEKPMAVIFPGKATTKSLVEWRQHDPPHNKAAESYGYKAMYFNELATQDWYNPEDRRCKCKAIFTSDCVHTSKTFEDKGLDEYDWLNKGTRNPEKSVGRDKELSAISDDNYNPKDYYLSELRTKSFIGTSMLSKVPLQSESDEYNTAPDSAESDQSQEDYSYSYDFTDYGLDPLKIEGAKEQKKDKKSSSSSDSTSSISEDDDVAKKNVSRKKIKEGLRKPSLDQRLKYEKLKRNKTKKQQIKAIPEPEPESEPEPEPINNIEDQNEVVQPRKSFEQNEPHYDYVEKRKTLEPKTIQQPVYIKQLSPKAELSRKSILVTPTSKRHSSDSSVINDSLQNQNDIDAKAAIIPEVANESRQKGKRVRGRGSVSFLLPSNHSIEMPRRSVKSPERRKFPRGSIDPRDSLLIRNIPQNKGLLKNADEKSSREEENDLSSPDNAKKTKSIMFDNTPVKIDDNLVSNDYDGVDPAAEEKSLEEDSPDSEIPASQAQDRPSPVKIITPEENVAPVLPLEVVIHEKSPISDGLHQKSPTPAYPDEIEKGTRDVGTGSSDVFESSSDTSSSSEEDIEQRKTLQLLQEVKEHLSNQPINLIEEEKSPISALSPMRNGSIASPIPKTDRPEIIVSDDSKNGKNKDVGIGSFDINYSSSSSEEENENSPLNKNQTEQNKEGKRDVGVGSFDINESLSSSDEDSNHNGSPSEIIEMGEDQADQKSPPESKREPSKPKSPVQQEKHAKRKSQSEHRPDINKRKMDVDQPKQFDINEQPIDPNEMLKERRKKFDKFIKQNRTYEPVQDTKPDSEEVKHKTAAEAIKSIEEEIEPILEQMENIKARMDDLNSSKRSDSKPIQTYEIKDLVANSKKPKITGRGIHEELERKTKPTSEQLIKGYVENKYLNQQKQRKFPNK